MMYLSLHSNTTCDSEAETVYPPEVHPVFFVRVVQCLVYA